MRARAAHARHRRTRVGCPCRARQAFEDSAAAEHGSLDLGFKQTFRVAVEDVVAQNREVGKLAGGERALVVLVEARIGSVAGEVAKGRFDRNCLVTVPTPGRQTCPSASSHRRVNRP